MALHHLHLHRRSDATVPRLRPVDPDGCSPATVADVARLLHLDAAHCRRAMVLWSGAIGVPVETLLQCVADRGDSDPGPPRWAVERTRSTPGCR
ncbi:hypothetical protein [Solicola sp. PLA-1-18]|uniref:hypothetical protein n=1 Tax=Solicola sp. PLA-1-18 TaxID=3380532 RepID=UPI003B76E000